MALLDTPPFESLQGARVCFVPTAILALLLADVLLHQPGFHRGVGPLHHRLAAVHLRPGKQPHGAGGFRLPGAVRQELPHLQPVHLLLLQQGTGPGLAARGMRDPQGTGPGLAARGMRDPQGTGPGLAARGMRDPQGTGPGLAARGMRDPQGTGPGLVARGMNGTQKVGGSSPSVATIRLMQLLGP